jgi:hypothetical protein
MWIRWTRIRIRIRNTGEAIHFFSAYLTSLVSAALLEEQELQDHQWVAEGWGCPPPPLHTVPPFFSTFTSTAISRIWRLLGLGLQIQNRIPDKVGSVLLLFFSSFLYFENNLKIIFASKMP